MLCGRLSVGSVAEIQKKKQTKGKMEKGLGNEKNISIVRERQVKIERKQQTACNKIEMMFVFI